MAQQKEVGKHATTIAMIDGELIITYHSTAIVRRNADRILLDTGGYYTATTKTRMNQASNQFELGYKVYQRNFNWFVDYGGNTHEFMDSSIELPIEA